MSAFFDKDDFFTNRRLRHLLNTLGENPRDLNDAEVLKKVNAHIAKGNVKVSARSQASLTQRINPNDISAFEEPSKKGKHSGINFFREKPQEEESLDKSALKKQDVKKIEVLSIKVDLDLDKDVIHMNDPDEKVLATATITYRDDSTKADGLDKLPDVTFSYDDPKAKNTTKLNSFKYGSKYLGKRDDAKAEYWEAHAEHKASSADKFNLTAKSVVVEEKPGNGPKKAVAKIWFKPSGVGGDNFKVKAEVYKPDDKTKLCSDQTNEFTVWRKIHFEKIYTMASESYIDGGTSVANIEPAFKSKAYVNYTRGAVNKLAASLDVKYLGLYKAGGGVKSWPADYAPSKLEKSKNQIEPTAAELADYAGKDNGKKATAKAAIEAKAALWFSAVVSEYRKSVNAWFTDAAVPEGENTLLAVQYYHPKLSGLADGTTSFWPTGISINMANPGSGLNKPGHPDKATWREVQGFNRGKIVVIFKNYGTSARLKIICRHEIGHATKSEFKRDKFGTGDHSSSGLMTPYGSSSSFSAKDIKILRGMS